MSFNAAARVFATATQPGRSGTYAPKPFGPFSIKTAYRIDVPQRPNTSVFQYGTQGPVRHVGARVPGDGYRAGLYRVSELAMTPARPHEVPTVLLKQAQQFAHFHGASVNASN